MSREKVLENDEFEPTGDLHETRPSKHVDDQFLNRFLEDTSWKSILVYQFLPGYLVLIGMMVFVCNIIAWLEAMFVYISINDLRIYDSPMILNLIYVGDFMYGVDMVFRISYKIVHWENQKLYNSPAIVETIVIDVISVIPYEFMYSLVDYRPDINAILRLRVTFRLLRLITTYTMLQRNFFANGIKMALFWTCVMRIIITFIFAMVHYTIFCYSVEGTEGACKIRDFRSFIAVFYVAIKSIMTTGADVDMYRIDVIYHFYSFAALLFLMHTFYLVAKLACFEIDALKSSYTFVHTFSQIVTIYEEIKEKNLDNWTSEDEQVILTLKDFYSHFLKQRNGILAENVLYKTMPDSITKSVIVDMAFDALKHSHIFRNQELHLLRFVSSLMRFEFAVPGEIVIKKGQCNNKMVYICHGVLQVLSQEDGETPVLSLSGGSCLGESTLFISNPSACTVVCQTYCELVVLHKKQFIKMITVYREIYVQLYKLIKRRVQDARKLRTIVEHNLMKKSGVLKTDILIMGWIKQFQRELLSPENNNTEIITEKLYDYIDNLTFYIAHLDRLVVSDEIELVDDSVFLKTKFHFILQPDSQILLVWDITVLLITVIYVILYPYHLCFCDKTVQAQNLLTLFVTTVYALDIYFQVVTAVKTRGATYLTPISIVSYRIRNISFILDCIATFPIDFYVITISGRISSWILVILQSNRLLKYYKINSFFKKLNVWNTSLMTTLNFIKYCIHCVFLWYYVIFLVYIINCSGAVCQADFAKYLDHAKATSDISRLTATYSIAISMLTGLNFGEIPIKEPSYFFIIYIIISIASFIFTVRFLSNTIATNALQNLEELNEQERLITIGNAIDLFGIDKRFKEKIWHYLKKVWYFRDENRHVFIKTNLPKDLELAYRNLDMLRFFERNQLFRGIPRKILGELCEYVTRQVMPAGMIICYAGEVANQICIIEKGYCRMHFANHNLTISKYYNIGLLETLLKIPILYTTVTETDCAVLLISKTDFNRFLSKHPDQNMCLLKSIRGFEKPKNLLSRMSYVEVEGVKKGKGKGKVKPHTSHHFGISSSSFKISHHSLMALFRRTVSTLPTHSVYLFYYEIFHSVCVFLNALLSLSKYLITIKEGQLYILRVLDAFSFVDICLRFFVTYFDHNGIEIENFWMTTRYYITHALITDLIATFPFDLIISGEIFFTRMNRILQLYRIVGFLNYVTDRLQKVRHFSYLSFLLIFIVIASFFSTFGNYLVCTYDVTIAESEKFGRGVNCSETSFLTRSESDRPLSPKKTHWESLLLLVSLFLGNGFRKYVFGEWPNRLIVGIWSAAGFMLRILCVGKVISYTLFKNADLTMYQDAMKNLVAFLSYCRIDKNVKNEVINYFEYIWEKRRGKNIRDVIETFPTALKKDALFNIYGAHLMEHGIFADAEKSFIKGLLLIAKQATFRKTGILYRVNDVHGTIFYLLKGFIEVVGPDNNRLLTLPPGSIFGCLDNCKLSRQTLTMVAKGHVETLAFSSADFHDLLSKYEDFQNTFRRYTIFNVDYLVGDESLVSDRRYREEQSVTYSRMNVRAKMFCRTQIFRPNKYLRGIEIVLFAVEFIFGFLMELYMHIILPQIQDYILLYIRDSFWVIRMYFIFHLAYEDEYGMLVFDRKKIAKRYLNQKLGFYFDLASSLPLDFFSLFIFPRKKYVFVILRMNRFLRVCYLFQHMNKTTNKLNINVLIIRSIYTLMYLLFYLEIVFAIYYLAETHWQNEALTWNERVASGLKYSDAVMFIFSGTCVPYLQIYGNSIPLILPEILLANLCVLVFLYSSFTSTLQIVTKINSIYLTDCNNLKNFMEIRDASLPLNLKIISYINMLLKIQNGMQFPFLLEEAPNYLCEAVLNSMFGFHLRNHYIFKDCHIDFLRQLSTTMRTETYFDYNYISFKGDIDETMYFIHEGCVHCLIKDSLYSEICEHVLNAGDSFGLNQILFPHIGQYYTYKTAKFTVVVTIKRKHFMKLLTFFPASQKHIYQQDLENIRF